MYKTIEKKIYPMYFELVYKGRKRFELRKDDDDIQIGDILILREWNGDYTGRSVTVVVSYVLRDAPNLGLEQGYCIIGF